MPNSLTLLGLAAISSFSLAAAAFTAPKKEASLWVFLGAFAAFAFAQVLAGAS